MLYEIISKDETPVSQMHIYLKNKTNDDGGNLPEILHDLAVAERVNPLYAFAVYCVITDNLTKEPKNANKYPTKEVMLLAFIQYLKGMATTIGLNKKQVSILYDNLKESQLLGHSPTLLNLDGDLFTSHYDEDKYFSKEAADEAEDSFPYWVIKIVKEIKNSNELITPKKNVIYELPYYIQNISNSTVPIYDSLDKEKRNIIGNIPPTGLEPVFKIERNCARLLSSIYAYVDLNDKIIIPVKHLEDYSELELHYDNPVTFPELPFDIIVKNTIIGRYGINNHYNTDSIHEYSEGDKITIKNIYMNTYGITEDDFFIPLDFSYIKFANEEKQENPENISEEHTKLTDGFNVKERYVVCVKCTNEQTKIKTLDILKKHVKNSEPYLYENTSGIYVIIGSYNTFNDACNMRKSSLKFGCKASVIDTENL